MSRNDSIANLRDTSASLRLTARVAFEKMTAIRTEIIGLLCKRNVAHLPAQLYRELRREVKVKECDWDVAFKEYIKAQTAFSSHMWTEVLGR